MDHDSSPHSVQPDPRVNLRDDSPTESTPSTPIPNLWVIYDSPQQCPYLDGKVSRTPLEYPKDPLSAADYDRLLEIGYRRTGKLFYRTRCPACKSCLPVRLNVAAFQMTKSMKRIHNRAMRELRIVWGTPGSDAERVRLFNEHRAERDLSERGPTTAYDYREFLVASVVPTREIAFYVDSQLIGVAILDLGLTAVNAVYTYFDPKFGRYSIGTLAVLLQIQLAIETGRTHVYLGLYVAENRHLNYKKRFRPQQRLIDGIWREIAAD